MNNVICKHYEVIEKTPVNNKYEYCWVTGWGVIMDLDSSEKCKDCPLNECKN